MIVEHRFIRASKSMTTPLAELHLTRRLRADSISPDPRGLAPPRPTSGGWLRLIRRLRADSASPDARGLVPPRPTSEGRLRLARRLRAAPS